MVLPLIPIDEWAKLAQRLAMDVGKTKITKLMPAVRS